jgi:hypothetical protein
MTLTPGVIHHIAGVRQSNTVYGYVDGRAVGSSALTAPTGGANGVLSIQSYSNGNVVAPQLGIASVKIKLAALSAAQIAAEALLTIGSYYPTVVP